MWLKVHCTMLPGEGTLAARETIEVYAGEGNQILQWLAHAACARLAHKRGEALGAYVPQSILDRDGRVLDPDLVLREAAGDGGELTVECGTGPLAFRARWDGRPKTPPFDWSDEAGGERAAPHDAWLSALDPATEGLFQLQDPEFLATGPGAGATDMARIKEVLVAHAVAAESFAAGPSTTPLSTKLLSLLHEALGTTVLADLQRKLERLHTSAFTPGALLLLRKGRSLTEQVLDRCQLKRVKARVLRVDLRHVLKHMQRWGLLGKEFGLPDVAPVVVFAKQQHNDPRRFALHPVPLSLDYGEVERLLLGTALTLAWARKRRGGFEEFLGEFLDSIYKLSGVLVDPAGTTQQGSVAGGAASAAGSGAAVGLGASSGRAATASAGSRVGSSGTAAGPVGGSSFSGGGAATAREGSSGGGTGGRGPSSK